MSIHLKTHARAAAAAENAALESIAMVYRGSSDDGQRYFVTVSLRFRESEIIYLSNVFLSTYRGIDWRDGSYGIDHGKRDGFFLSGLATSA